MSTTNRVFKTNKVISLTFSNITSDGLLPDSTGLSTFDLSDVDWTRIVVEYNLTSLTSTGTTTVTFTVRTTNNLASAGATSVTAVKANGSTVMGSGAVTTATKGLFATGKIAADGSAASNIGKYIMIHADVDAACTDLDGTIDIYIEGR